MQIYGDKKLAQELRVSVKTIRRIRRRYRDFPCRRFDGVTSYVYDIDQVRRWWRKYSIHSEWANCSLVSQSHFAAILNVSNRLVLYWRRNGMPVAKLRNGSVWIELGAAKAWLMNQSHPKTRSYASQISMDK